MFFFVLVSSLSLTIHKTITLSLGVELNEKKTRGAALGKHSKNQNTRRDEKGDDSDLIKSSTAMPPLPPAIADKAKINLASVPRPTMVGAKSVGD